MIKLTCDCCNFSQEFKDGQEAFEKGWDAPPYFSQYISCNLCPGSFIVLGKTSLHNAEHKRWEEKGRPFRI